MIEGIFTIVAIIGISIWLNQNPESPLASEFYGIRFGLCFTILVLFSRWIRENRKDLALTLQSLSPFYSDPKIRLSIAYLFRISLNGKYLLVRNARDQNHAFQPVGGVYKYLPGECHAEFERLGILTDSCMPVDEGSNCDLRIKLKHRKALPRFLKWFRTCKNREVDPVREFHEELVRPGILPNSIFPYIRYKWLGTHQTGIQYSEYFKMDEFLLADIVELLPTQVQNDTLQNLQNEDHPDILWATEDEIRNGRKGNNVILPHTKKLFDYQTIN